MQSVVFVQLASQYIHSSLGGWAVASGIAPHVATVTVLDLHINQPIGELLQTIMQQKPDVLGFGAYIWNVEWVWKLASSVRALLPSCTIFVGGPEVLGQEKKYLQTNPCIDFIITGAGENSVANYLTGMPYSEIAGFCFRTDTGIQCNPPDCTQKYFPSPYCDKYIQTLQGRIAYIETTRGCPFSCSFCLSGEDKHMAILPYEDAISRIERLAQTATQTIKFVDRTFNAPRKHAHSIWRYLLENYERFQDKRFHFEIGADLLDESDFALLATVPDHYFQMEAGIQSFHAPTLLACRRKTDMEKLERNLKRLIALGTIPIHVDLIAGLPYEDLPTFLLGFDKAFSLHSDQLQLGFLKLLHGSALYHAPAEYGYKVASYPPYEILGNQWLSYDDILLLKSLENVLETISNHGRYPHTLAFLLEKTGLRPSQLMLQMASQWFSSRPSHANFIAGLLADLPPLFHVSSNEMRNVLLLDELIHTPQGALPKALHKEDERLKQLKRFALQKYPNAQVRVGIIYEQTEQYGVIVYTAQGRAHVQKLALSSIGKSI